MRRMLLVSFLIISGCATHGKLEHTLQDWQGHDANQLVEVWGPPDKTFDMPNGNKVYEYFMSKGLTGTVNKNEFNVSQKFCKIDFMIDQLNTVKNWRYNGNICRTDYPNSHLPRN